MKLMNLIQNMIRRARITLVRPDTFQNNIHQVSYNGNTLDVDIVYPYGLFAVAPINSEVIMWNIMGEEENKAGIAHKTLIRFKNLEEGEVIVGNPVMGSKIFFDKEGNINVTAVKNEVVNIAGNATINVTGDTTLTVTGDLTATADTVSVTSTNNMSLTAPTVAITGDMTVTGDIDVDGSVTDNAQTNSNTMKDMRDTYNTHTHDENGTGGGVTDPPNQPI